LFLPLCAFFDCVPFPSFPLSGKSTMVLFHGLVSRNYVDRMLDPLPYHILRKAWEQYLFSLWTNEEHEFTCFLCGQYPDLVLFDGTLLACRKDQITIPPTPDLPQVDYGSRHKERILVLKNLGDRLLPFFSSNTENPVPRISLEVPFRSLPKEFKDFLTHVIIPFQDSPDVSPLLSLSTSK